MGSINLQSTVAVIIALVVFEIAASMIDRKQHLSLNRKPASLLNDTGVV